jgi:hypothetical protein
LAYFPAAYKTSKDYSVLPDNGSGDFTYSGGGNAVSQRPDGLWQVGWPANTPRNAYVNGVLGRLAEPQRQLLISYPRNFARAEWAKTNGRIEGDAASVGSELFVSPVLEADWSDAGGGNYSCNGAGVGTRIIKNIGSAVGEIYLVTVACSAYTSGSVITHIGGSSAFGSITINSATSITRQLLVHTVASSAVYVGSSSFIGSISVSVKKVTSGFPCPFVNNLGVNTNEGFKFVATAANAILRLTTAHTSIAASTYTNSVFLKRVNGTGQVSIIDVNNVARPITITDEWQRYEYAAAALTTSGQIGIQLATSGDEVMICHAQAELGAASTSPIYGTEGGTRTREADDNRVDLPSGVTEVQLTNMSDTVTTDASPSEPYVMPLGTWKKIIMI